MTRLDRYIFAQFVVLFGFFSLTFILVFWINRAVGLFDQIISSGQSILVFFELSILLLPSLIKKILPLAAFASTLYVTNKLYADSELVILQATGHSPLRLIKPTLFFALLVFIFVSLLSHYLAPLAAQRLSEREHELAQNISAQFLKDGQFIEPVEGVTLYIQGISPQGELTGIFLSDQRHGQREVTYTASKAYLLTDETATQLVMQNGMAQSFTPKSQQLITSSFDQLSYDLSTAFKKSAQGATTYRALTTDQLLAPSEKLLSQLEQSAAQLRTLAHGRIMSSLLGPIAALLATSILLSANFSRFGLTRHIIIAVVFVVILLICEAIGVKVANAGGLWDIAVYFPLAVGLLSCGFFMWSASKERPRLQSEVQV